MQRGVLLSAEHSKLVASERKALSLWSPLVSRCSVPPLAMDLQAILPVSLAAASENAAHAVPGPAQTVKPTVRAQKPMPAL